MITEKIFDTRTTGFDLTPIATSLGSTCTATCSTTPKAGGMTAWVLQLNQILRSFNERYRS